MKFGLGSPKPARRAVGRLFWNDKNNIWQKRISEMEEYRVYEMEDDGHIVKATPLICSDDHEAIARARELAGMRVVEIWSGERFVTRLSPRE